jgi:hypothetical protein
VTDRYLLFCGNTYYPEGGWADHNGGFDSIEQAFEKACSMDVDWYHIVDTYDNTIALWGGRAHGSQLNSSDLDHEPLKHNQRELPERD